jgi:hypothetical protein
MPIDMANAVITDMREVVKDYLDRKLSSAYRSLTEQEFDLKKAISDIEGRGKSATGGDDKNRHQSHVYDTLKSNKLPMALLSLGAAAGGLGWIYKMLSESGETVFEWIKSIKDLGDVQPGEGFTQILNRTMDAGLNPNSSMSEVADKIREIGGGDYNKGVELLTKQDGIFEKPGEAKKVLDFIGQNEDAGSGKLGKMDLKDFFKGNLAGTGASPADMLVTKAGGVLAKMVLKQAVKSGVKTAAMAPLAKVLGVVGVAGALAAKFSRWKGLKSSRFKVLDGVYQTLRDIKPTEENPIIIDTPAKEKPAEKPAEKTADKATPTAPTKISQDAAVVKNDFENNSTVKTALSKIDTADEFRDLILQMSQFVSANLRKDKASLKSALFGIANMVKGQLKKAAKVQEDYSTHTPDSDHSLEAIEAVKSIAQHLGKISDRKEFADLIYSLLPMIDPEGKITQDKVKLANIIFSAASRIDKFVDDRDKNPAKKPGGLG